MKTTLDSTAHYWLLLTPILIAVLSLVLIWPYSYVDYYAATLVTIVLFLSCLTIPSINNLRDNSFKIWCISSVIVPLPLLILFVRLFSDIFFLSGYYVYLVIFFLLNYIARKSVVFVPIMIISLIGSIVIWGVTELFSDFHNDFFWKACAVLTFFQEGEKSIKEASLYIVFCSIINLFYYFLFSKLFIKKVSFI